MEPATYAYFVIQSSLFFVLVFDRPRSLLIVLTYRRALASFSMTTMLMTYSFSLISFSGSLICT